MPVYKNISTYIVIVALAGCSSAPEAALDGRYRPKGQEGHLLQQSEFVTPYPGDGGIVMAQTSIVGRADAVGKDSSAPDCTGAGYGVTVETSLAKKKYLFDADGSPCDKAKTIFDGKLKVHQRASAPSVNIAFLDGLGPLPAEKQKVLDMTVPTGFSPEYPEDYAVTAGQIMLETGAEDVMPQDIATQADAMRKASSHKLEQKVNQWQAKSERAQLMKETERLLADVRDVGRLSSNQLIEAHQDKIEELMARLREAERQLSLKQHRQQQLLERLKHTRESADAVRLAKEQHNQKLISEKEQLSQRLAQIQKANSRLKQNFSGKEEAYQQKIATLSGNLHQAEQEAGHARQEIVLEAAKKIAEAERLAYAARLAKKDAMQREASRLQKEADLMLHRAHEISGGRTIVIPGLENIPDLSKPPQERGKKKVKETQTADYLLPPLESVPIVIHEEDRELGEIFDIVFKNMEDKVGKWKVSWQLSGENQGIPKENWTVAAESRFDEFLSYVSAKIQKSQGIQLNFQRFDKNRLFVISD